MEETEEIVASDFDPADAVINHDVAEVLRSQPDDPLGAVFGVDEMISEICKAVDHRLELVCGENTDLHSPELSVFSSASLMALDEQSTTMICVEGDEEEFIACMLFKNALVRRLITTALAGTGDPASPDSESALHPAETALLRVIADQIMQACFEAADTLSDIGFPGRPEFVDMKRMAALVEANELVKISLVIGEESTKSEFQLLVPLAVFDNTSPDAQENADRRKTSEEERQWTSRLLDQIEILEIPLSVQLASANLPLAQVDALKVGNRLALEIDPENISLRDSEGHIAFMARLLIEKQNFQLSVRGVDTAEGG